MSTTTLAVNDSNDFVVGADGNLSIVSDIDAVAQGCKHAAATLLSEKIYAQDDGVPYFDVAWGGTPNLAQLDAALRRALLSVDGVQQVTDLQIAQSADVVNYRAVIQTLYGSAAING